jgi:6-phospho-beta-glucosidase
VGGQEGRHRDIQLGLRHDLVGQETTGVGGFAKALRTVPVMLALCREMERACPQAWLINFTNPSGLVTEAILKHGWPRAIGLCNIPLTLRLEIAAALGVEPNRVSLDYLGLNHLSWVRRVWVDGVDVLPQALQTLTGAGRPANIPEELDYPVPFLRALGMVPNAYLRYYYLTRRAVAELKAAPQDRAQEVMRIETELLDIYRDPAQHRKPEALKRRGGAHYSTAAIALLKAIAADTGDSQVVNARNGSAMPALGPDAVIEVTCRVDRRGAVPLPLENPPPEIRGLMQHVKAYEELAVEAAVSRSRRSALMALVTHPLVGDAELADTLLDEICTAHQLHLEGP